MNNVGPASVALGVVIGLASIIKYTPSKEEILKKRKLDGAKDPFEI